MMGGKNMNQKIAIFEEEFESEISKEKEVGVTVVIEGQFKKILDTILSNSDEYSTYMDIITDALIRGVNKYKE